MSRDKEQIALLNDIRKQLVILGYPAEDMSYDELENVAEALVKLIGMLGQMFDALSETAGIFAELASTLEEKNYVFTFGANQKNAGKYVVIRATDFHAARRKMIKRFGTQWAGQYESKEDAGAEQFGLEELEDE